MKRAIYSQKDWIKEDAHQPRAKTLGAHQLKGLVSPPNFSRLATFLRLNCFGVGLIGFRDF